MPAEEKGYGIILTSSESMPRKTATVGMFVATLERELAQRPADEALVDQLLWLRP